MDLNCAWSRRTYLPKDPVSKEGTLESHSRADLLKSLFTERFLPARHGTSPCTSLTVFVSRVCNKSPQTGRLKATEMCSFIVLEARNPKSRDQQGHVPYKGSGRWGAVIPASSSFWWPQVFLGLWLHHSSPGLCCHMAFSSSVL